METINVRSGRVSADVLTPVTVRRFAAAVTGLAGVVHYALVPAHRAEWWLVAALFTIVGGAQLGWALLAWRAAGQPLLLTGAAINLAALGAWFTSRVWGLPFGLHSHAGEAVGAADFSATLAEAVAVAAVVLIVLRDRRNDQQAADQPSPGRLMD